MPTQVAILTSKSATVHKLDPMGAGKNTGRLMVEANLQSKNTVAAATDTATLTATQVLSGVVRGVPTGAASYTLPTVALILAALPGAKDGQTFDFVISNKSGGANTVTVLTATGWTLEGTVTVAQNVCRLFRCVITSVASATATLHGC